MSGRYRDINYSLRPAKAVERKLLCEAFRRLDPFAKIEKYRYIGFGSLYFSDFQLFHRSLGIQNMLSIEKDANYKESFLFNKPYRCIDLDFRRASDALPDLDWAPRTILWLDYEGKIGTEVLSDVRTAFARASSGSFLLVSVNVQPDPEPDEKTRRKYEQETKLEYSLDQYRLRQLRARVGAALPSDIAGESLRSQKFISALSMNDIIGTDSLATQLNRAAGGLSGLLKPRLSETTLRLLEANGGKNQDPALKALMVDDLNAFIGGPSLYNAEIFDAARLREETQMLVQQNPIGFGLARLNRLLLEEAYPSEISKHRHGVAGVTHRMINNVIQTTLSDRNAAKPSAEQMEYHQLFNFLYNDNARMLTVGGLLVQASERPKYGLCNFNELSYVRTGADPYEITIPCLTMKEIGSLNSQLPKDQAVEPSPTSGFALDDFEDFPSFLTRLKGTPDAVSSFLIGKFREETRMSLTNYTAASGQLANLRSLLAADLDGIVKGNLLYESERFATVSLRSETKLMLRQGLAAKNLARLNRQLLEDAYPSVISRHHLRVAGVSESDVSSYEEIYRYFPTFAEAIFV